jgi:hypothetical protein
MISLRDPSAYHGGKNTKPFFEGWYHKMVMNNGQSLVIIPGIYRSGYNNNQTAFIMIFDGSNGDVFYEKFEVKQFSCSTSNYSLHIGSNYFSLQKVILDIESEMLTIKGQVNADNLKPWPVTLFEPGCMGWYAYVPTMECFHGILSMDHSLNGEIEFNGSNYDFADGRGYIEKDWGRNFPENWIWAQSNNFTNNDLSITASLATIPWKNTAFAGFIVGLYYNSKLYRFTTYRNTVIQEIHYESNKFYWKLKQKTLTLELTIEKGHKPGLLYAPGKTDMVPRVHEYLDGSIYLKLYDHKETILEDHAKSAAIEIIGDTNKLINMASPAQ